MGHYPVSQEEHGMSLEGRIALISGASRGVGRAIALGLAADGADVAVNYNRDSVAAEKTAEEIRQMGRNANVYQASVQNYSENEAMINRITSDMGPISILVHNAGIASKPNNRPVLNPRRRVSNAFKFLSILGLGGSVTTHKWLG